MGRYIVNRIVLTIPTLLIVALVVFCLMHAVPGDPIALMVGDLQDPQLVDALRQEYGLDRPLYVQFFVWLGNISQLDFGRSLITHEPVLPTILHRFGMTLPIVLLATLIGALVALPIGMLAAWKQNTSVDFTVIATATLLLSVPSFWVGLMLITIFGVELRWLPTVGYVSPLENLRDSLPYLVMPTICLVLIQIGSVARLLRATAVEVLRMEYITHARAKGLSELVVLFRHAFPNAFGPVLSWLGLILGSLLAGAAVIETVFTIPGLGRLMVDSIYARDYPMVQAITLFVALIYIAVNLVVDLLYPLFDPRVRL